MTFSIDDVIKQESSTNESVEKRLFVQELLLSMLSNQRSSKPPKSSLTSFESNQEGSHETHNDELIALHDTATPTTKDSRLNYVIVEKQTSHLDQLLQSDESRCSHDNAASSSFALDLNGSDEDARSARSR